MTNKFYFPSLLFIPLSFLIYLVTALLFSYDSLDEWVLVFGVFSDFFIILIILRYAFFTNFFKVTLLMYFISIIYVILSFSFIYSVVGVYEMNGHLASDYWSNIYFSTITWTALGYGDMYPSVESRKYVMLEVSIGYIHMSLLVSLVLKYLEKGIHREGVSLATNLRLDSLQHSVTELEKKGVRNHATASTDQ